MKTNGKSRDWVLIVSITFNFIFFAGTFFSCINTVRLI